MYVGAVIIPPYVAEFVLQTYANLSRRPSHISVIVGYGAIFGVEGASHVVLCATLARRELFCWASRWIMLLKAEDSKSAQVTSAKPSHEGQLGRENGE
jgi:hypothetical protein